MAGTWGGAGRGQGRKPQTPEQKEAAARRREAAGGKPAVALSTPKAAPRAQIVAAEAPKIAAEANIPGLDHAALAEMLPRIQEISERYGKQGPRTRQNSPFKFAIHPPFATPKNDKVGDLTMANDSALVSNNAFAENAWLAGGVLDGVASEGLLFPGFAYLSELAQRPEYRVSSETIADDATRRWIDFDVTGDEQKQREERAKDPAGYDAKMADPDERKKRVGAAGKQDRVKALKDDQERLEVRDRYYALCRDDGFMGRAHLYANFGLDLDDPKAVEELKMPIGDGRDELSRSKIGRGSFKELKTIEAVWTYPLGYNAVNPLRDGWYKPTKWYVMGQEIDATRLMTIIARPVPDLLKPAYSFGGLSLSQLMQPYVDIWLTTRQSVADLIHSFSVMVLMTDLSTILQPGSAGALLARVALFNMLRDNQGTFVINKNTEDFKNVSASLSGLHELQAQAQEHMASVNRIPLVKFTGISPSGLNASSEGEIMVYDDTIEAYQNRVIRPSLTRVVNFQQLSLWGEIDPEITIRFNPLRVLTEKERGEKQKRDAERDQIYADGGAISPAEWRKTIIDDPDLPFTELNPDDVPEPPAPADGDEPGEKGDGDEDRDQGGEGGGGFDSSAPFFPGAAADSAEWDESKHPRAPSGQFGEGSGVPESPFEGVTKGKFVGKHEGNLGEKGLKPRKKGNSNSPTQVAQIAWGRAIESGKPVVMAGSAWLGWQIQLEGDTITPGQNHIVVMPNGDVLGYKPDLSPATLEAAGSKKEPRTKFGGLWRATGGGAKSDFEANANAVLGKPPRAGESYRSMVKHLVDTAAEHGGDVDALKKVLGQAYAMAGDNLSRDVAAAGDVAAAEKLSAKRDRAYARARELGYQKAEPAPAPKITAEVPPAPDGAWNREEGASPKLASFRSQTRDDLVERGKREGLEDMTTFDLKGDGQLDLKPANRGAKTVGFSPEIMGALGNPGNSLEMHHNHPSDSSFSGQDLEVLAHSPRLSRLYAHGHMGSSYGVSTAEKDVGPRYKSANRMVYDLTIQHPNPAHSYWRMKDKLGLPTLNRTHQHALILGLERAGAIGGYSAHLAPDLKAAIDENAEWFEGLVQAAHEGAKRKRR